MMEKERYRRHRSSHSLPLTVALLLIVCLIECTTGSCLSYGHSCWGAHGKRSGKPDAAPDWFINKLFRRIDSSADLNNGRIKNSGAIYPAEAANDGTNESLGSGTSINHLQRREPEAKPMLDEEVLANIKLWQMMQEAAMGK